MALTQTDIREVTGAIVTALAPRFAEISDRFAGVDQQLSELRRDVTVLRQDVIELREDVDTLAAATKRQFDMVVHHMAEIKEDLAVVKDIVKDHSFRLARLEHRAA